MKTLRLKLLAAIAAFTLAGSISAVAQLDTVTVKGHVTDPVGQPVTNGEVRFTTDKNVPTNEERFTIVAPVDANGNYVAKGVKPGEYWVYVFQKNPQDPAAVSTDRQDLAVRSGVDVTLDFDMTSERYLKDLSPERKKEIEDYKKKAASSIAVNAVINNLNKTMQNVRADLTAAAINKGDVTKDIADMKSATDAKPDESVLWIVYGDTLQAQAEHLAAADSKANKPITSDDDAVKLYNDAGAAYQKGIDLNAASKKPIPADQAVAYNSLGNIQGRLGKVPEASAAYDSAVKLDSAHAGMYYGNEAIVLYRAGQNDGALAAADKAIATDTANAIVYYIKGQSLIGNAKLDPNTNLYVLPPGCLEAYQKFIELEPPTDPKVKEVQDMLASLNIKVETTYKAPSTKKK